MIPVWGSARRFNVAFVTPSDRADHVAVAHYGARNGSTALTEKPKPRLALISVGADNDYGHPGPEILEVLEETE